MERNVADHPRAAGVGLKVATAEREVDIRQLALQMHQRAFGAEEVARMTAPGGTVLVHVHVYINGHSLMMNDPMPEMGVNYAPPAGYALTLIVDDIDMWFKRAVDAGCTVATPVDTMFWGDRYGEVIDPFGIRWSMNEPAK